MVELKYIGKSSYYDSSVIFCLSYINDYFHFTYWLSIFENSLTKKIGFQYKWLKNMILPYWAEVLAVM